MRSACARTALLRRSITQRSTYPTRYDRPTRTASMFLIDVVDAEAPGFAALASLVRPGGTAVSTNYVADVEALRAAGITGINFALPASSELFERVADTVADARIVAPPITRISLEEAPAALNPAQARPASGKTVITGRA